MKKLLIMMLLLSYWQLNAQKIGKDEALVDLKFLKESIQTYNPALSFYHPEFNDLTTQTINSIKQDSLGIFDHFSYISQLCALANEGHFSIGDWEDVIHKGILENAYAYLPIQVKIISGDIFVWEDYSNERTMSKGDSIVSINGIKTESILDKLLSLTPSDGDIKTYAYRKIEDAFPWIYYFHIEQPNEFSITYSDQNKEEKTVLVKALIRSEQVSNYRNYFSGNTDDSAPAKDSFYQIDYKDNYALLTLPSFDFRKVNKYDVKSKKLYKTIFSELQKKKTDHLIIDLRNNTGGRNEFADDIVPFILKVSSTDSYIKKTVSWEGKERVYKLPKASKLVFRGDIYVLINGKTYSAGSSLARYLKEYGNAIMIGTESGTRYEGFAAGSRQDITLPNSQIKIGIPRYHITFPISDKQKTKNKGLLPDHQVIYSIKDRIEGVDLHMEKAISLINEK